MNDESKFKVLSGNFGTDPDVKTSFLEVLREIFKKTNGNMRAYAIVIVTGPNECGTAFDCGDVSLTLSGGIRALEKDILEEADEVDE